LPTIEELLNSEYELVKAYILRKAPFMLEYLKDSRMKNKLIKTSERCELIWLAQEIPNEYANVLFDEEGIKILKEASFLKDKVTGIVSCGKEYVSNLFANKDFCEIVNENFEYLYYGLSSLNLKAALEFIKYIENKDIKKLKDMILVVSSEVQYEIIKQIEIPKEILKPLILKLQPKASEYLINNDFRITSIDDYSFDELFSLFKKKYNISKNLLNDSNFVKKIISMNSVKDYRFLVNELTTSNDTEFIEKMRKSYYDEELLSYDSESKMLKKYQMCYSELCNLIDKNETGYYQLEEVLSKYLNLFGCNETKYNMTKLICDHFINNDKEWLKNFFINESNVQISNMIVDYHFEDVPYNFFLDVRQLYNFQKTEGRTLNDEDLNTYAKLLNIDDLTYAEKMSLHDELSKEDWIAKHYDIFREAKDKNINLIKEQMLNDENIDQYLDKQLTEKTSVPIYVLDGQDFFAFVKSLHKSKEYILTDEDMINYVDGGSFSLDGSKKLNTFRDPRNYYNLIYSDFPKEQVVHMYPVDSFSKYIRKYNEKPTGRVYELYTPTEFVEKSSDYNEIVLAQKNERKHQDELNDNLKLPKLLGIYCYDKVTNEDVESAKKLGIGIVVVKTNSYKVKNDNRMRMFDTISPSFGCRYVNNIDYLLNVREDDMIGRRSK